MMHWFSISPRNERAKLRRRESSSSITDSSISRRRLLRRKRSSKSVERDLVADSAAPWRIHNILKAPPSAAEWWEEPTPSTEEETSSQSSSDQANACKSQSSEDSKVFQNRGYDAWEKARAEWRTPTATTPRKKPAPVKRETVIRGVTSGSRTYELPRRMTLPDMIGIYHQIWSAQDD